MKFIEAVTKEGAQVALNMGLICYVFRKPMENFYSVASPGVMTVVDSLVTPYDQFVDQLDDQFVPFDIPEGTTAHVNPQHVLFVTSPQLGITVMLFIGGLKLVVREGETEVQRKLGGGSTITLSD